MMGGIMNHETIAAVVATVIAATETLTEVVVVVAPVAAHEKRERSQALFFGR
jgi:hypothetical protein